MKKLLSFIIIAVVILFGLFSCTQPVPDTIVNKYYTTTDGLNPIVVNQQVFPEINSVTKSISLSSPMKTYVAPNFAEIFNEGIMCGENSFINPISIYYNVYHQLDLGTQLNCHQQMLVYLVVEVLDRGENADSSFPCFRTNGSNEEIRSATATLDHKSGVLVLTDINGIVEWYHVNGSYYNWNWQYPENLPRYGWEKIKITAAWYCVGVTVNN